MSAARSVEPKERARRPSRIAGVAAAASACAALACQTSPAGPGVCSAPRDAPGLPARGISAHRGGTFDTCPENTRAAFCRASCEGVHQIEFDVRATADAGLVVSHDDVAKDAHGTRLRISDATLEDVLELEKEPCDGASQKILTFEQALAIMPRNVWLNVDIKSSDAPTARLVAEAVAASHRFDQVVFGSRGSTALAVRRVAREVGARSVISNMNRGIFRCLHVDETIARCDDFIQFHYLRGLPRKRTLDRLKENGVRVNYAWLHQEEEDELEVRLKDLFDRGVDFVLVDHPREAMRAAVRLGIAPVVPDWGGANPCGCASGARVPAPQPERARAPGVSGSPPSRTAPV